MKQEASTISSTYMYFIPWAFTTKPSSVSADLAISDAKHAKCSNY